jgi:hypothetical protein
MKLAKRITVIVLWLMAVTWWAVWVRMTFFMSDGLVGDVEPAYAATLGTLCWVAGVLFSWTSERSK